MSCSLQEEEFFISLAQQQREVRSVSRSRQQTLTPLAWPDCAGLYNCTEFWFSLSGLGCDCLTRSGRSDRAPLYMNTAAVPAYQNHLFSHSEEWEWEHRQLRVSTLECVVVCSGVATIIGVLPPISFHIKSIKRLMKKQVRKLNWIAEPELSILFYVDLPNQTKIILSSKQNKNQPLQTKLKLNHTKPNSSIPN